MKKIHLKTFGKILMGREEGRNSYHVFKEKLSDIPSDEKVFCDFTDVMVMAPSFCDEVFGEIEVESPGRLVIDKEVNLAIKKAFETVEQTRKIKFEFDDYDSASGNFKNKP